MCKKPLKKIFFLMTSGYCHSCQRPCRIVVKSPDLSATEIHGEEKGMTDSVPICAWCDSTVVEIVENEEDRADMLLFTQQREESDRRERSALRNESHTDPATRFFDPSNVSGLRENSQVNSRTEGSATFSFQSTSGDALPGNIINALQSAIAAATNQAGRENLIQQGGIATANFIISAEPVDSNGENVQVASFSANFPANGSSSTGLNALFSNLSGMFQRTNTGSFHTSDGRTFSNMDEVLAHLLSVHDVQPSPVSESVLEKIKGRARAARSQPFSSNSGDTKVGEVLLESSVESSSDGTSSNRTCSVCMGTMVGEELTTDLVCDHIFHLDCIVPWLQHQQTCPVCRRNIEQPNG